MDVEWIRQRCIRCGDGARLLRWLGERDHRGLEALKSLIPKDHPIIPVPLLPEEPTTLPTLRKIITSWCQA